MNKHINNILQGMANLWPYDAREYSVDGGGFKRDAENMQSDFRKLGDNMRTVLKKHEQTQSNQRYERELNEHI